MISPTYNSSYIEKFSKLERMCGKNGSFIIEKGPFVELMTATGMTNQVFEYRNDCKCLFQRNTLSFKILVDHCKWPPELMTVLFQIWLQMLF